MKDCDDDFKLEGKCPKKNNFITKHYFLEKLRKLDGTVIDIIDHCSINLYFLLEN